MSVRIKHTHILIERGPINRTLAGGSDIYIFFKSRDFHPRGLWFSNIHIRTRSHSRQAGLCCTGCCQVTLSMASAAADPSRGCCWLLTTHTTMSPVNPPLYGFTDFDATCNWPRWTVAVAAWGPALLYASPHSLCLHLIRSPLPLVCIYCLCVFPQTVYQYAHLPLCLQARLCICVHLPVHVHYVSV